MKATFCDLSKECDAGIGLSHRFGNDAAKLIHIERKLSLRQTKMFVVASEMAMASEDRWTVLVFDKFTAICQTYN